MSIIIIHLSDHTTDFVACRVSSALSAATQSTVTAVPTAPIGFSATQSLSAGATNTPGGSSSAARALAAPKEALLSVLTVGVALVAGGVFALC